MTETGNADRQEVLSLLSQAFDWARYGDVGELTTLLDAGCRVDLTNDRGDTLLILSAYHQQRDIVRMLLERGADTERVNDNGQTALGSAVFRSDAETVRALLTAGADPDHGPRSARSVAGFFGLVEMQALLARCDSFRCGDV